MGLSGIGFTEILLILLVLLLLFGSKKLPGIASDLGAAIRGFRRAITNTQEDESEQSKGAPAETRGDDTAESSPRR
jgi:sec-independent protein translocase protein TatA